MQRYLPVLRQSPFFAGLDGTEILSVMHCIGAAVLPVRQGKYLLRAGDTTEVMGLVLSGSALIVQEDLWGHRNILSRCRCGDFFGEPYAAKPGAVLNICVVAEQDGEIMTMNVRRLLSTCDSACIHHRNLIRNLVNVLAEKILIFNDKITHVSKRTTREKLLSYLSAESIRRGSRSFDIPFDRQQLADFLCVERSAMSAELSKLAREGYLKTDRNRFELLNGPCGDFE
ncbi:MAG: Crp/Fnr family transcriptional regulator [Clostridia bacterium]|nr:Crp/Fnr family transcriptional regulator [Clostridia bacterium]